MKNLIKKIYIFAFTIILLPIAAIAGESGPYISGALGASFLDYSSFENYGQYSQTNKVKYNTGFDGSVAAGYKFEKGFRSELELGYDNNLISFVNNSPTQATGRTDMFRTMINNTYDFYSHNGMDIYTGFGLGVGLTNVNNIGQINGSVITGHDTLGLAQGILGTDYDIAPRTQLFINYKYLTNIGGDPSYTDALGDKLHTDYRSSIVEVGLKYSFGAPASHDTREVPITPPPMPKSSLSDEMPPAVEHERVNKSRSYLAFFDFNSSKLTPDAVRIIKSAALDIKKGFITHIEVTGHTDTVGSDAYNMRLSQKRAEAVKHELVKLGIKSKEITLFAKGKRELLVPTPDGVKEAQNRRAEIVYTLE